jgi:hypothetical protein
MKRIGDPAQSDGYGIFGQVSLIQKRSHNGVRYAPDKARALERSAEFILV